MEPIQEPSKPHISTDLPTDIQPQPMELDDGEPVCVYPEKVNDTNAYIYMGVVGGFLCNFFTISVFLFICMYCCVRRKNGGNKKKPPK